MKKAKTNEELLKDITDIADGSSYGIICTNNGIFVYGKENELLTIVTMIIRELRDAGVDNSLLNMASAISTLNEKEINELYEKLENNK